MIISKLRVKYFNLLHWHPLKKDLERVDGLVRRQIDRGYDLYEHIDKHEKDQLVELKHQL